MRSPRQRNDAVGARCLTISRCNQTPSDPHPTLLIQRADDCRGHARTPSSMLASVRCFAIDASKFNGMRVIEWRNVNGDRKPSFAFARTFLDHEAHVPTRIGP
jgi:hypothetical protein